MQAAQSKSKPSNSWGIVPVGASMIPVRHIVMWTGLAGWVGLTLSQTGPIGITAVAFNVSVLLGLILLTTFTRSVPLRTVALMFFSGGVAMALALGIERVLLAPPLMAPLRNLLVPFLEETIKLIPLFFYLYRVRKFTLWTVGVSDTMLMGAALGAGFAFVFDAYRHIHQPWQHHPHVQWLPTADMIAGLYLSVGHAVLGAIAGTSVGIALLIINKRKTALIPILIGVSWCIFDHAASLNFLNANSIVGNFFKMLTLKGFASVYIFGLSVAVSIAADLYIGARYLPRSSEFKLPKRKDFGEGLSGMWDFILDRRRLAYANRRRKLDKSNTYASMTVAILTQSLINYHTPPRVARSLAAVSTIAKSRAQNQDEDDEFLEPESLQLPEQYQLVSKIRSGGMGAIYKGRHRKTNALLAIKILHKHVKDKKNNRERFDLEAKAASKLKHPNLVVIHDYGITSSDTPYIVMELIDGETLQSLIGTYGGLPPSRFFPIFEQVCDALAHAHSRGVIHRDLKPSNIIIAKSDSGGDFAKVVDFGIAKVINQHSLESQELTRTGDIMGSPMYMSPEQCIGEETDARTDVYALGCVMYEAITGKPPLYGENVVKTIFKHINVVPDPISKARPDLNIPPAIEAVIFRALEKKPDDRFGSMADFKAALLNARNALTR